MGRIFIKGDCHGGFAFLRDFCKENNTTVDDTLIILGDAGINYFLDKRDRKLKEYIAHFPITLFCIHGNHEERPQNIGTYKAAYQEKYSCCCWYEEEFPNILFPFNGTAAFNGKKFLIIGGAYSVDKFYRLERGWSWFESEQLTNLEKEAILLFIEEENSLHDNLYLNASNPYFSNKEQIDLIINNLSEKDKLLIKRAYGDDYENPVRVLDWTSDDSNMLYHQLFVKIKNLLKEKYLRKYFSIYERLSDFSKEEIDDVIKILPKEDINVFNMAYGTDYENPKRDILYNPELNKKLRNILYKMKKLLNKTERKKNKEIGKLYEMLKDYTKEEIDRVIDGLNEGDKQLLFRAYGSDYNNPIRALDFTKKEQGKLASSLLPKIRKRLKHLKENELDEISDLVPEIKEIEPVEKKETMTKEAYIEILSLLKTPSFGELLNTLDVESAVIVVLKLGYIRDNYYSSSIIGNFLGISEEEVNNKFANVLDLYKKSFNNFIDDVITATKEKKLK